MDVFKDGIMVNLTEFEMSMKLYMPLAVQISKGNIYLLILSLSFSKTTRTKYSIHYYVEKVIVTGKNK